jgi:hypothetical protein
MGAGQSGALAWTLLKINKTLNSLQKHPILRLVDRLTRLRSERSIKTLVRQTATPRNPNTEKVFPPLSEAFG